jgi:hypothetical protein
MIDASGMDDKRTGTKMLFIYYAVVTARLSKHY